MRYRTIHCIECGAEILERNRDTMYRLGDSSQPAEVNIGSMPIDARCGNCMQQYTLSISLYMHYDPDGPALYMQPQTIQLAIDATKKLRNIACMECGKVFHTLSDRVGYISDNRVPFELLDPLRPGPIETLCHQSSCHQSWSIMV
jgi:DNA-directed RNA polymerase subunit RPC12/RpoP